MILVKQLVQKQPQNCEQNILQRLLKSTKGKSVERLSAGKLLSSDLCEMFYCATSSKSRGSLDRKFLFL